MHKILANTIFLGKNIIHLPECHSTNDVAMQKYRSGEAPEGTIVITDKQTEGRGQRGNQWLTQPNLNLTFSLILTPVFLDASEQFGLNMAVSLGIREALSDYVQGIIVKWPNDILHEENGKIGGILIENSVTHKGIELAVVGVGLNINQTEFPFPKVASLAQLAGAPINKEEVFKTIISRIEKYYIILRKRGQSTLKEMYRPHLYRFERWSTYNDGEEFIGRIVDISDQGKLIVEKTDNSIRHYSFQEVRFV